MASGRGEDSRRDPSNVPEFARREDIEFNAPGEANEYGQHLPTARLRDKEVGDVPAHLLSFGLPDLYRKRLNFDWSAFVHTKAVRALRGFC
jgi:hypothetical protein